jgi:hypothetical protein
VVADGVTAKFTPLAVVPMEVPPVETVNHLISLPAETAFICDVEPQITDAGVAVAVGVAGSAAVNADEVLYAEANPLQLV